MLGGWGSGSGAVPNGCICLGLASCRVGASCGCGVLCTENDCHCSSLLLLERSGGLREISWDRSLDTDLDRSDDISRTVAGAMIPSSCCRIPPLTGEGLSSIVMMRGSRSSDMIVSGAVSSETSITGGWVADGPSLDRERSLRASVGSSRLITCR